jgi:hypothetical protein
MHAAVVAGPALLVGRLPAEVAAGRGRTRGLTRLVYGSVRAVTTLAGAGLRAAAPAATEPRAGDRPRSPGREAVRAAVNGVVGDHLARTGNPLAIPMRLRGPDRARDLALEPGALARDLPGAGARLLVLVHGACQDDLRWTRRGHDHGAALARDLGYTPVYVHYNSGLHVSTNGRALADALEALSRAWPGPLDELSILGHSMGGLVARSAFHAAAAAGLGWPGRARALVLLGTPHHGAPLERGGSWADVLLGVAPHAAPLGRLGRIRSAGVTDLRHGSLVDEDWAGRDRFDRRAPLPRPVPLPEGVRCHAVAASLARRPGLGDDVIGDGLVPVSSALGDHPDPARALGVPEARRLVVRGAGHFDLLDHPEVYARVRAWLGAEPAPPPGTETR